MARNKKFDPKELHKKAMAFVKDPDVYFVEDVIAHLGISKGRFYDLFPGNSDELDAIKKGLEDNAISKKVEIRKKMLKNGQSASLIALYKILATDDERRKLSTSFHDHTTKGKEIGALVPEGTKTADMIKTMESRIEELKKHNDELEADS